MSLTTVYTYGALNPMLVRKFDVANMMKIEFLSSERSSICLRALEDSGPQPQQALMLSSSSTAASEVVAEEVEHTWVMPLSTSEEIFK